MVQPVPVLYLGKRSLTVADVNAQIVEVYRGEEPVIPFAPPSASSIASKTLVLYLAQYFGSTPLFTFTVGDGLTIDDATAGTFTWTITRARLLTLTGDEYTWETWDTVLSERLAGGRLFVRASSRPTS